MSLPMRWEESTPSPVTAPDWSPKHRRRTVPALRLAIAATILLSILSILGLAGVGAMTVFHHWSVAPELQPVTEIAPGSKVALGLVTIHRQLGFVTVTGSVASQITSPLSDVEAVVELLDSQNRTLTMESAMISFRLLSPKQSAPFRVEVPDDSHAVGYRIHFKKLDGEALD